MSESHVVALQDAKKIRHIKDTVGDIEVYSQVIYLVDADGNIIGDAASLYTRDFELRMWMEKVVDRLEEAIRHLELLSGEENL